MTSIQDKVYIKRCIELALKGVGKVSPNPLVGAVIVKEKHTISEGWHKHYGDTHAEAMAINNATENLKGATLYCNLEPCCHTKKKTPPCTPLIINSGIKRVFISNTDPNPQVAGKAIKKLRDAGIEVIVNVLEEEGHELNRAFFKHIVEQKPWITVKIAQTIDGKIGKRKGTQTWITGKESARYVHKLRSECDAVLVGCGTVKADNPQLNVRHVKRRNPLKIIIDSQLSSSPDSKIFKGDETWIFHAKLKDQKKTIPFSKKNVQFFECNLDNQGKIDLNKIIQIIGERGVSSLLIEGGQNIFSQFISQSLFDEIIILQGPVFFGEGVSSIQLKQEMPLKLYKSGQLGDDFYFIFRKKV